MGFSSLLLKMNYNKDISIRWFAMVTLCCIFISIVGRSSSHPVFVNARLRRSLLNQRELVKRIQLQSMLKQLEGSDSDLNFAAALDEEYRKRAAENDIFAPNKAKKEIVPKVPLMNLATGQSNGKRSVNEDTNQVDNTQSKLSWDIINRNVPLNAPIKQNTLNKRGAPCRKRRSVDIDVQKRHLKTPPGEGLVPQYNLYDEICEDSQPVEVVKIKKLIVEDGIIKDNDIVEASMIH